MRRENVGQTDEAERERVTAKKGRRKERTNQFQKQQFENCTKQKCKGSE
jgi:hypothetical protein